METFSNKSASSSLLLHLLAFLAVFLSCLEVAKLQSLFPSMLTFGWMLEMERREEKVIAPESGR